MLVVSEKAGGRRGKELVSPIVMEGAYAAIRRVQEARRKEILQVGFCTKRGGWKLLMPQRFAKNKSTLPAG